MDREGIRLRAIEVRDLEMLYEMINDQELNKLLVGWSYPTSKKEQEEWYDRSLKDERTKRFVIETQQYGEIGIIVVSEINWKDRSVEIGIKTKQGAHKGKGIARQAYELVIEYLFDELGFNRIEANILQYNDISLAFHQRLGFKQEGVKKEAIYRNGRFNDIYIYSLLRRDWSKKWTD